DERRPHGFTVFTARYDGDRRSREHRANPGDRPRAAGRSVVARHPERAARHRPEGHGGSRDRCRQGVGSADLGGNPGRLSRSSPDRRGRSAGSDRHAGPGAPFRLADRSSRRHDEFRTSVPAFCRFDRTRTSGATGAWGRLRPDARRVVRGRGRRRCDAERRSHPCVGDRGADRVAGGVRISVRPDHAHREQYAVAGVQRSGAGRPPGWRGGTQPVLGGGGPARRLLGATGPAVGHGGGSSYRPGGGGHDQLAGTRRPRHLWERSRRQQWPVACGDAGADCRDTGRYPGGI
ncbi:MAG: Inositol-1-monophosphatase, partial [uncultured Thermomicrobiales bacterium]